MTDFVFGISLRFKEGFGDTLTFDPMTPKDSVGETKVIK